MSVAEIILLSVTLLAAVSIVWGTLQAGISPMPSSDKARAVMLQLCAETGSGAVYELGCGWGNLLIPLARKFPQRQIIGYELSLLPWLTCWLLIKALRLKNVTVCRANFLQADLSAAETIVCYLYPQGMQQLSEKLADSLGSRQYLISNNFALPGFQPLQTVALQDFYRSPVYLYRVRG